MAILIKNVWTPIELQAKKFYNFLKYIKERLILVWNKTHPISFERSLRRTWNPENGMKS
jgi:hypothetical protein